MAKSSPGQNTLVNEAFSFASFQNINQYEGWGYSNIEFIILKNPDYIFTTKTNNTYAFVNHPAYEKLTQSIVVPVSQRYTLCSCPTAFINLIEIFNRAKQ
jgi:ABC-type Fe3+-hydroxamate transport system substrate-binding protein